jgi:hypothetical protein
MSGRVHEGNGRQPSRRNVRLRPDRALDPRFYWTSPHKLGAIPLTAARAPTATRRDKGRPLTLELGVGARQALIELGDADLVLADHRASYPLGVLVEPALTFDYVRIDLLHS